jgi:non-ribosomal peptide synthetase component E (peptide arylation enzyme)
MNMRLHDYLARSADRDAESVALVMGEESFSYGELEGQTNRLAGDPFKHLPPGERGQVPPPTRRARE